MSLSLQNSTKIVLAERTCGHWLIRTSALSELAGIRIVTEGSTGLSGVKRAIQQTQVSRRREEVRDDHRQQEDRARDETGSHTLSGGEEPEAQIWTVSTNRTFGTRPVNMKP